MSGASKNFSKTTFSSQLKISAEINGYLSVLHLDVLLLVSPGVCAIFWRHLNHKIDKLG